MTLLNDIVYDMSHVQGGPEPHLAGLQGALVPQRPRLRAITPSLRSSAVLQHFVSPLGTSPR